jgi:transcriptional regulator with XRE-family HTH domain
MGLLNDIDVGNRLKKIRLSAGISSREFSLQAGIDPSQYSKIEKGSLPVTENVLQKLADRWEINEDYVKYGTSVPRVTEGAVAKDWSDAEVIKAKPEVQVAAAIREITESARLQAIANSEQAQANKQQAEANYLSEKNRARILEILQPTAGADAQTIEATIATVLGLRKYIAQLAADLKNESLAAIISEIDKIVLEEKSRVQNTGTPAGVGM